jgi:hypothetical protein
MAADIPTGPPGNPPGNPPGGSNGGYQGPSNIGAYSRNFEQNQNQPKPEAPPVPQAPTLKGSIPDFPFERILKGLEGSEASLWSAMEDQAAFLERYKKELDKATDAYNKANTDENFKKKEEALKKFVGASKVFSQTINSEISDSLKSYTNALEKSSNDLLKSFKGPSGSKDLIKTIEEFSAVAQILASAKDQFAEKLAHGMLTKEDAVSFQKLIVQAGKVKGLSSAAIQKDLAEFMTAVNSAMNSPDPRVKTDQAKRAWDKAKVSIEDAHRYLTNYATSTERLVTEQMRTLQDLEARGKGLELKAKLLRAGGYLKGAPQVIRESEGLGKLTGGASTRFGGQYVKEGGEIDQTAIQAQLLKNLGEIGKGGVGAYRKYGSEFGAMDRGYGDHTGGMYEYTGHQGRMARIGVTRGRTGEEVAQTFDTVAKTYRVGNADIGERKRKLEEITKSTIDLSNATGLTEEQVNELSAAYRNNLGKGVDEAKDAGYQLAQSLTEINRGLEDDFKITSSQLQRVFVSLAKDSNNFGKDMKEINYWAANSANYFGKMRISLEKSEELAKNIALIQTGGKTTGAGITSEIALLGTKYMKIDQGRMAKAIGGEDKLKELAQEKDEYIYAEKSVKALRAAGQGKFADSLEKARLTDPLAARAYKALATNDLTELLALSSNKEGQNALAKVRSLEGFKDVAGYNYQENVRSEVRKAERRAFGGSTGLAGAALGRDSTETWEEALADESARNGTPRGTPEEEAKKVAEAKEKVEKSAGGYGKGAMTVDPMTALSTLLSSLKDSLFWNTTATFLNTAAMGAQLFRGGIPGMGGIPGTGGPGTGGAGAAGEAAEAAKAAEAAEAAEIAEASEAVKSAEAAVTVAEVGKSASWMSRIPGVGKAGELLSRIPGAAKITGIGMKGLKAVPILGELAMLGDAAYKPFSQMNDKDFATRSLGEQLKHGFSGATESFGESGENFKKGNWGKGLLQGAWGAIQGVFEAPGAYTSTLAQRSTESGWYDKSIGKLLDFTTRSDSKSTDDQMQADAMIRALRSKSGKTREYDFSNMSPEEREKYAKELESKKKELQEAERSTFGTGFLTGRTDRVLQKSLQMSIAEVQKKVSWDSITAPLGKKETTSASLTNKEAQEALAGSRSLEADMGFNPGTNEIIFKVTNAPKVMLKSLNQEFRNTAHA